MEGLRVIRVIEGGSVVSRTRGAGRGDDGRLSSPGANVFGSVGSVGGPTGEPGAQDGQARERGGCGLDRVGGEMHQIGAHAGAQNAPFLLLERLMGASGAITA